MPASEPAVASSSTVPRAGVDQPVAGAQRPPLARHRIVRADAEAGNVVVELDLEPVARPRRRRRRRAGPAARCAPASRSAPESARPARRAASAPPAPTRRPHKAAARPQPESASAAARPKRAAPSCDDVHQPVGHDDHLARRRPGEDRAARRRWRAPSPPDPPSAHPWRRGIGVAQLAVDLDGDGDLVLDQQGRVRLGPGGVGDQARCARPPPRPPRRHAAPSARPAAASSRPPRVREAEGGAFSIALASS